MLRNPPSFGSAIRDLDSHRSAKIRKVLAMACHGHMAQMWQIVARCRTNTFIIFICNLGAAPTFTALNKHAIVSLFGCFAGSSYASTTQLSKEHPLPN